MYIKMMRATGFLFKLVILVFSFIDLIVKFEGIANFRIIPPSRILVGYIRDPSTAKCTAHRPAAVTRR